MAIHFLNEDVNLKIKEKSNLKRWIEKVIRLENKMPGLIQFVFCSDESLLIKNQTFLSHNTLTDIITFDYSTDRIISGEIYISLDRVKENALKFNCKEEEELRRVIIHGVLHLCGYEDKSEKQKKQMRNKENNSLILFDTIFNNKSVSSSRKKL